jgi:glucosamine-6-phosphate deaminase
MRFIVCDTHEEIARLGADMIEEVMKNKKDAVLGLATGSTPVDMYAELIRRYEAGTLDFSPVRSVNLDEYYPLAPDNDQSYRYFMNHNLFDHVNIPADKINLPNGNNQDDKAECAAYDEIIAKLGGVDLQLLGIGHDGHIGFNEPSDAFDLGTHCVDLTEETIEANKRFFNSKDEVPRQAYTMGTGTIMNARKVLMIASGKDKAAILKKAFFGPITPQVPASILQMHPNFVLVADEDALSLI